MYQVLDMLGTETSVQELRETVGALQKAGVSGGWAGAGGGLAEDGMCAAES